MYGCPQQRPIARPQPVGHRRGDLSHRVLHGQHPFVAHVPDPIVSHDDTLDLEHEVLLAESIGLALLVVLDTLNPAERLAFVLRDTFGVPFEEIAPIVGRSASAARQLASGARRREQGATTAPDADRTRRREVVRPFSPPRAAVTSTRLWWCSTRTWYCDRTAGSYARAPR